MNRTFQKTLTESIFLVIMQGKSNRKHILQFVIGVKITLALECGIVLQLNTCKYGGHKILHFIFELMNYFKPTSINYFCDLTMTEINKLI